MRLCLQECVPACVSLLPKLLACIDPAGKLLVRSLEAVAQVLRFFAVMLDAVRLEVHLFTIMSWMRLR